MDALGLYTCIILFVLPGFNDVLTVNLNVERSRTIIISYSNYIYIAAVHRKFSQNASNLLAFHLMKLCTASSQSIVCFLNLSFSNFIRILSLSFNIQSVRIPYSVFRIPNECGGAINAVGSSLCLFVFFIGFDFIFSFTRTRMPTHTQTPNRTPEQNNITKSQNTQRSIVQFWIAKGIAKEMRSILCHKDREIDRRRCRVIAIYEIYIYSLEPFQIEIWWQLLVAENPKIKIKPNNIMNIISLQWSRELFATSYIIHLMLCLVSYFHL